jgi:hypothetical protein
MDGHSYEPYRWTPHKITLAYLVAQSVSNFVKEDILRQDNMHNVVRVLNKKSQFAMSPVTDNDVMTFFEEERQKYCRICELSDLPYVNGFFHRLRTVLMRHDCVDQHIKVCDLLYVISTHQFMVDLILNYFL